MTRSRALEEIAYDTGAIYEPDQFPTAILKTKETKRTYLIFNSGKIILPGLKTMKDLDEAV
jgi:transcription initiation factor TFIID TATA-box-binding protein